MRNFDSLRGGSRERLASMRAWIAKSGGKYNAIDARKFGIGRIAGEAHGPIICDGYAGIPASALESLRDCGDSHGIVRSLPRGWYTDHEFQSDTYSGHVWQLPARKGAPIYIAGILDQDAGYCMLNVSRGQVATFDDKDDAARAGDELARVLADRESDYREKCREVDALDDAIVDARDTLRANRIAVHEAVAALRETCNAPHARKIALSAFHSAHATFKRALRDIARASVARAHLEN